MNRQSAAGRGCLTLVGGQLRDAIVASTADPDQYPPTMVVFKHGEPDAFKAACANLG